MSLTEFDIGPLTWVKGEIDTALHKAKEQLAHFAANIGDTTPLRFAQPHLHQVKGAIQMVGLDGLARFAEEVERFMAALEAREVEPTADTLDLLDQGFNTIAKYLDELMGGAPDVPLKLSAASRRRVRLAGSEASKMSRSLSWEAMASRPSCRSGSSKTATRPRSRMTSLDLNAIRSKEAQPQIGRQKATSHVRFLMGGAILAKIA